MALRFSVVGSAYLAKDLLGRGHQGGYYDDFGGDDDDYAESGNKPGYEDDWEGYKNKVDQGGPAKVKKLFASSMDFALYDQHPEGKMILIREISPLKDRLEALLEENMSRHEEPYRTGVLSSRVIS